MKDSLVDFDSKPEGKPVLCEAETDDEGAAPEEVADDAREDLRVQTRNALAERLRALRAKKAEAAETAEQTDNAPPATKVVVGKARRSKESWIPEP